MRRTRGGVGSLAACLAALLALVFLAPGAGAQDDPAEPVDTDGDGQRDDWDGDGEPDNDDDNPCEWDDKDDAENTGNPDGIPDADGTPPDVEGCEGEGGSLPDQLTAQRVRIILSEVFANIPDVTEPGEVPDSFPNIRRLFDENGNDIGPDWTHLDDLVGEPGVRDLLQEPDDRINQALLEAEDLNNEQIIDPLDPNRIVLVATSEAMDHTINQIERARGDLGLVGGSGSELSGPCMGMAWSYDSDGQPLDVARDWDQDGPPIGFKEGPFDEDELPLEPIFTSDNPFIVDVDGAVIYTGLAGGVPDGTGLARPRLVHRDQLPRLCRHQHRCRRRPEPVGREPQPRCGQPQRGPAGSGQDQRSRRDQRADVRPQQRDGRRRRHERRRPQRTPVPLHRVGLRRLPGRGPPTAPGVALVFLSTVGMLFNARPAKTWGGV